MVSSSAGTSGEQIARQLKEVVDQLKVQNELLLKITEHFELERKIPRQY